MLKVTCASCGKSVKSSDEWAGRTAKWPNCNAAVVFPAVDEATPAMSAPEERGPQSAAAARYSAEATPATSGSAAGGASAGSDSSKASSATATVAARRQCVCCGQATPANS